MTTKKLSARVGVLALVVSPALAVDEATVGGTVDIGPTSSTAVVFLHGWLMSPELWRAQLDELCDVRRCRAVAQPGHGSAPLGAPHTMAHWAERLRDELAAAGIERAVLVGHSMGGMLALEFTRRYPERVLGLGLVGTTDTPGRPEVVPQVAAQMVAWNDEMAAGWARLLVGSSFLDAHPGWLAAWQASVADYDRDRLGELMTAIQGRDDLTTFTPTITVPTTVIHCRADGAVPFSAAEGLVARIPDARLAAIDDCGHAVPMERPAEVAAAIEGLLQRLE
jgi:pimeloyl-ACP methyl ester carboxylesterase